MDGAEGVGGATVPDRLGRNCSSLRLMVAWSMAHIMEKWMDKEQKIGIKST